MNAEDTIKFKYEVYHDHRTSALHHLFIVNGNGYEWVNGELVDIFCGCKNAEEIPYYVRSWKQKQGRFLRRLWGDSIKFMKKIDSKRSELSLTPAYRAKKMWQEERIKRDLPLPQDYVLYPLCEYADIMNVPDDVTPDWLAAAFECINWALSLDPEAFRDSAILIEHPEYKECNSKFQEQIKLGKEELIKRFSGRFEYDSIIVKGAI